MPLPHLFRERRQHHLMWHRMWNHVRWRNFVANHSRERAAHTPLTLAESCEARTKNLRKGNLMACCVWAAENPFARYAARSHSASRCHRENARMEQLVVIYMLIIKMHVLFWWCGVTHTKNWPPWTDYTVLFICRVICYWISFIDINKRTQSSSASFLVCLCFVFVCVWVHVCRYVYNICIR